MVHDHTSQRRRKYLKRIGALSITGVAGCLGGESEDENTDSGSTPTETSDGTQTEASDGDSSSTEQSPEEWRTEMANKAEEELSGDSMLHWYTDQENEELVDRLANGSHEPPWDVLDGNIETTVINSGEFAARYEREMDQEESGIDLVDMTRIPEMVKNGIKFTDISDVPAWQDLPEGVKDDPRMGAIKIICTGGAYNSDNVSDPPTDLSSYLDDRFTGGSIGIDPTVTVSKPAPLLDADLNPDHPRLQSVGIDMSGSEFLQALGDQELRFESSGYGMLVTLGQGEFDVVFQGYANLLLSIAEDRPIELIEHPSVWSFQPMPIAVGGHPDYPAAAKLFLDWLMSHPDAVVENERGVFSPNMEKIRPASLEDFMIADEFDNTEVWSAFDVEDANQMVEDYQEYIGAPSL